jgi:hypothetical protein
VSRL